ncbi:MAG: DUF1592 domain-containing protein [Myxococcota bacterium]
MRSPLHLTLALLFALAACRSAQPPDPPDPPPPPDPTECTPQVTLGTPLRLLTRAEYNNTVRDLLGAPTQPANDFPREPLAHLLDNDWSLNQVSPDHVSRYLEAAEALSVDTVANRKSLVVPCGATDAACGAQFLSSFGRKAYRRPLTAEESAALNTLFTTTLAASDFDTAVEYSLQVMLQSPQFLYRDESAVAVVPVPTVSLSGYELATRLSYFLWATTPDEELLDAAETGALDTPEGLKAQAQRMLDDPRAVDGMVRFFSLWLNFGGIQTTEKDQGTYPQFSRPLAQAWRTSLELYVRDVLTHEGTLPSLLSSNVLFTNDAMNMYGPAAPSSSFVRNEMPGTTRAGLLVQPAFLAFKAMPDGSSPVRRGIFVLDQLLCDPPAPPPPGVPITPPPPSTSATTRERFKNHSTDPNCYGCHKFIDPIGFTFEHYDGMGQWRDTENGKDIDATGAIVVSPELSLVGPLADVNELAARLSKSPRVHGCVSKEVYRYALGRHLTEADECTATRLADRFFKSGGDFRDLFLAIVESDAFRSNANPEMTP